MGIGLEKGPKGCSAGLYPAVFALGEAKEGISRLWRGWRSLNGAWWGVGLFLAHARAGCREAGERGSPWGAEKVEKRGGVGRKEKG